MKKKWFEIKVTGYADTSDLITAFLIEFGGSGILEEDGCDGRKILKTYINIDSSIDKKVFMLKDKLKAYGWDYEGNIFKNKDWLTKWKRFIKPVRVSEEILVKPTWHKVKSAKGNIVIEIDPGMAFGTGSHASTLLCMKTADRFSNMIEGRSVLDVGTGSGILAILSAKLGAKKTVGIDIDADALKVARKNVKLNKVADRVSISARYLEDMKGKFSVIFANIIAEELIRISELIKNRTKDNGLVILSGILKERAGEVKERYKSLGFKLIKTYTKKEWVCLVFNI